MSTHLFADANDDGIRFILQIPPKNQVPGSVREGGIIRYPDQGHFVTIAGRGGTAKSVLALQFLTALLEKSKSEHPAAFYFSLEASPKELATQLGHFRFGRRHFPATTVGGGDKSSARLTHDSLDWESHGGLYIHAIPSPIEDLTVLIRQVRQNIARILSKTPFDDLVGIVIDPLGGVRSRETLRTELSSLKHLADSPKI